MHRRLPVSALCVTLAVASCALGLLDCGGGIEEAQGPDAGDAGGSTTPFGESDANGAPVDIDAGMVDVVVLGADSGDSTPDATSPIVDASLSALDAALASIPPAPAGIAGFALVINDVVQSPTTCSGLDWAFVPYPAGSTDCMPGGGCLGVTSVLLVNTGTLSMPYLAAQSWELGVHYEPDAPVTCAFGPCLSGVLEPGAVLDITSTYNEGVVALLGSADPFSTADASSAYDEGTIPWPSGVAGSGGATTMQIAEISVPTNGPSFMCHVSEQAW